MENSRISKGISNTYMALDFHFGLFTSGNCSVSGGGCSAIHLFSILKG